MESKTPKTISFRSDDVTSQKMERIRNLVFEGREVSNTLILKTAVDYLHDNYGKGLSDTEDVFKIVKAYITVAYLYRARVEFDVLDGFLSEVEQIYDEHYPEEVLEIAKLYDNESPITIAQLIRFSNRTLPETFLRIMEVDKEDYIELTDDELAEFLLNKFSDEKFKFKANKLFDIV